MSRAHPSTPITLDVVAADVSVGTALVVLGDGGVCAVLLGDDPAELRDDARLRFPGCTLREGGDAARARAAAVFAAIDAPQRAADAPLDLRGTEFQRTVWRALRDIPAGSTATYSDIAARIGRPSAARAVAQACAANAHAVLIPCHRVVRGDGALAGYRWGVHRKRALLDAERG